eukprot:364183-Chlamydomonas_euryale.AAC.5
MGSIAGVVQACPCWHAQASWPQALPVRVATACMMVPAHVLRATDRRSCNLRPLDARPPAHGSAGSWQTWTPSSMSGQSATTLQHVSVTSGIFHLPGRRLGHGPHTASWG